MIGAAIVGLGAWGRHLAGALRDGGAGLRVVRGVDTAPEAAAGFAAANDFPVTAEYGDALDDPAVGAVILATPHALHADQAVAAAEAGKHVFVEKPLALSRADAERAVDACRRARVVLGVGHERRFEPALIEIKRLIDDGELGVVLHAEANFSHDLMARLEADSWRFAPEHAPAAGMTGTGVHLTDSLIAMLGRAEMVWAQATRRVVESEGGDVLSAHLRFRGGATAYINSILVTPFFMRFRVFGSAAWVEARETVRPEEPGVTHLTLCRAGGKPETREIAKADAAQDNLAAFAAAAAGGAPYPIPHDEMIHNVAILEAVAASVASGAATPVA